MITVYPEISFEDSGNITLDTNVLNAVTASLNVEEVKVLEFTVKGATGTHATHSVVMEMSPDDINFFEIASTVKVGEGMVHGINCSCLFVRLKVKVAEGATSTCTVRIQGK